MGKTDQTVSSKVSKTDSKKGKTLRQHAKAFHSRNSKKTTSLTLRELETLVENAPAILFRMNRNLRLVYVNPEITSVTGIPKTQFLNKTFLEVGFPEDLCIHLNRKAREAVERQRLTEFEFTLNGFKGPRWFHARIVPELDVQGAVETVLGIAHDITALREAEETLRRNREDLDRAQEVGQIGSWRLDVRHNVLTWSDENHRIFGVPRGTPMSYEAFLGIVHPEDRQYVDTKWQAGLRGEPYDIEHRIVVAGQVKWVREKAYLEFDEAGKLLGGFGITHDITALREAQETLRRNREDLDRAQEVGQIGSWRLDVRHNVLTWSDETHRIFGVPKGTPMSYETFLGIVHPEDRQYVDTKWQAGLRGDPYDIEHRIVVAGQVKWVREKAYLEFDETGKLLGGFGIAQDITERKRTEEEIKTLNEDLRHRTNELENAYRELEAFTYSVSHDLKAPLIVASGFCHRLSKFYGESLDVKGRHYLSKVQESCQHMTQLIEDLLGLSKATTTQIKLETFDVSGLVESIAAELKEAQPDREIKVIVEEKLTTTADLGLLRIALENLLSNSWKFTGNCRPGKIAFGLEKTMGEEPTYFVRDNGCGFDMAKADCLFQPFQRLHESGEFPGTGIGLATVQRVISRLGGRIWAESEVGKGATFYFTLPLRSDRER